MIEMIDSRSREAYQAGLRMRDLPPELIDMHMKIQTFISRIPPDLQARQLEKATYAIVALLSGVPLEIDPTSYGRGADMRPRPVTRREAQQRTMEDQERMDQYRSNGKGHGAPGGRNTAFDQPLEPIEESEEAEADYAEVRQQEPRASKPSVSFEPLRPTIQQKAAQIPKQPKPSIAHSPGPLTMPEWRRVPPGTKVKIVVNGKTRKGKFHGTAGENRLVVTYWGYPRPVHAPPDRVSLET